MPDIILKHPIVHDEYTAAVEGLFDVPHLGDSETIIHNNIQLPEHWNIGLIYGPSGSGKSSILRSFGNIASEFDWEVDKAVVSQFKGLTPAETTELLSAVGFSSAPSWMRPYSFLSNGEQFRCNLARALVQSDSPILIDEFTSVVDRNVAKSASHAVSKYIRKNCKKVILASCHADIIEWLGADWFYNPTEALTHTFARGSLRRPPINLKVFRSKYEAWNLFKHHHYLSADLNKAARCFLVTWNDNPVAFSGVLAMPNPYKKNCWRESRTVVLPDYQGLGIGVWLSDYIGSMVKSGNASYYSKTIHPAMISHRMRSEKWEETSHSGKARKQANSLSKPKWEMTARRCFSFEYVGEPSSKEDARLFWENLDERWMSETPMDIESLSRRDKDLLRKKMYRLRKKNGLTP